MDNGYSAVGTLLFLFFGCALPVFVNFFLARSRGKNIPLMLLLTLIFSWLVTLVLACMPKIAPYESNSASLQNSDVRTCPFCAEFVKSEAVLCKYCGKELPPVMEGN